MWPLKEARPRVSWYGGIQLTSVLLPGLIILAELWLLLSRNSLSEGESVLRLATRQTEGASVGVLVIAVLLALCVAYAIGLLARELSWFASERLLKFQPVDLANFRREFQDAYGPEGAWVVAKLVEDTKLGKDPTHHRQWVREYCKLWLRIHQPALAIDHMEAGINLLVALFAPLALGVWVAISWLGLAIGGVILASALLICALGVIPLANHMRRHETWTAIRNFVLAQWFSREDFSRRYRVDGPDQGGEGDDSRQS